MGIEFDGFKAGAVAMAVVLTTLLSWVYIQQTTAMSLNPPVEEIRQECIDRFTKIFGEIPSEDNINICVGIVLKGLRG